MQNAWIIARRELGAIFVQPIAYIFIAGMMFITGIIFAGQLSAVAQGFQGAPTPTAADFMGTFTFLGLFVIPAITMRMVSEERQSGTVELLMTMPVTDGQVIIGKFLAAFVLYAASVALTLIYPFVLLRFGNPDIGPMVLTYLLALLWGTSLVAIGIFASTVSMNQINAFMISFTIILLLYLFSFVSNVVASLPGQVSTVLRELSLLSHQDSFFSGVLTAKDVLYYLIVTGAFLFAAARIFESRRWR